MSEIGRRLLLLGLFLLALICLAAALWCLGLVATATALWLYPEAKAGWIPVGDPWIEVPLAVVGMVAGITGAYVLAQVSITTNEAEHRA